MRELRPEARRLVDLAQHEDDPPQDAVARVERALARRVAAGAGAAVTTALVAKSAVGAGVVPALGKGLVAFAIVASAAGAGWLVSRSSAFGVREDAGHEAGVSTASSSPTVHASSTIAAYPWDAPDANATASAQPLDERKAAARPVHSHEPRPAAQVPSANPPVAVEPDRLLEEAGSLRAAHRALASGDPELALRLIDEQEARFSGGQLAAERLAARVFALCDSGRVDEARRVGRTLERGWPRSPLVARLRTSCAGSTNADPGATE